MKHLAQALAILSKAENALEADYDKRRLDLMKSLEQEFASRLRLVRDAKKAVLVRFQSNEAIKEEYFGELKLDTPRSTAGRIRRSIQRERARRTSR